MQQSSCRRSTRQRQQVELYGGLKPASPVESETDDSEDSSECDDNQATEASSLDADRDMRVQQQRCRQSAKRRCSATRTPAAAAAGDGIDGVIAHDGSEPASKRRKSHSVGPTTPARAHGGGGAARSVLSLPDGGKKVEVDSKLGGSGKLNLPGAFCRSCFPNLPNTVELQFTVDGEPTELPAEATGEVICFTRSSGRQQHFLLFKQRFVAGYHGYHVTHFSTNSSSSQLTIHSQSPAARKAAEEAEAAEGWFSQKGPDIVPTLSNYQVCIPIKLVRKAFGPSVTSPVLVELAVYRDTELVGSGKRQLSKTQRKWRVSVLQRQLLKGYHLVKSRARKSHAVAEPNRLEVYFASRASQPQTAAPAGSVEFTANAASDHAADAAPAGPSTHSPEARATALPTLAPSPLPIPRPLAPQSLCLPHATQGGTAAASTAAQATPATATLHNPSGHLEAGGAAPGRAADASVGHLEAGGRALLAPDVAATAINQHNPLQPQSGVMMDTSAGTGERPAAGVGQEGSKSAPASTAHEGPAAAAMGADAFSHQVTNDHVAPDIKHKADHGLQARNASQQLQPEQAASGSARAATLQQPAGAGWVLNSNNNPNHLPSSAGHGQGVQQIAATAATLHMSTCGQAGAASALHTARAGGPMGCWGPAIVKSEPMNTERHPPLQQHHLLQTAVCIDLAECDSDCSDPTTNGGVELLALGTAPAAQQQELQHHQQQQQLASGSITTRSPAFTPVAADDAAPKQVEACFTSRASQPHDTSHAGNFPQAVSTVATPAAAATATAAAGPAGDAAGELPSRMHQQPGTTAEQGNHASPLNIVNNNGDGAPDQTTFGPAAPSPTEAGWATAATAADVDACRSDRPMGSQQGDTDVLQEQPAAAAGPSARHVAAACSDVNRRTRTPVQMATMPGHQALAAAMEAATRAMTSADDVPLAAAEEASAGGSGRACCGKGNVNSSTSHQTWPLQSTVAQEQGASVKATQGAVQTAEASTQGFAHKVCLSSSRAVSSGLPMHTKAPTTPGGQGINGKPPQPAPAPAPAAVQAVVANSQSGELYARSHGIRHGTAPSMRLDFATAGTSAATLNAPASTPVATAPNGQDGFPAIAAATAPLEPTGGGAATLPGSPAGHEYQRTEQQQAEAHHTQPQQHTPMLMLRTTDLTKSPLGTQKEELVANQSASQQQQPLQEELVNAAKHVTNNQQLPHVATTAGVAPLAAAGPGKAPSLPPDFLLKPYANVAQACEELLLLLELLSAPDDLMQRFQTASASLVQAEAANGQGQSIRAMKLQYKFICMWVKRGRADQALDAVRSLVEQSRG